METDLSPIGAPDIQFERQLMALHSEGKAVPAHLHHWLKMDTWRRDEGLPILLGLLPGDRNLAIYHETLPEGETRTVKIVSARFLDGSAIDLAGLSNLHWLLSQDDPAEIDPYSVPPGSVDEMIFCARLRTLEEIWDSGDHAQRNAPTYFLDWAKRKDLDVPWLEWAIGQDLLPGDRAEGGCRLTLPMSDVCAPLPALRSTGADWTAIAPTRADNISWDIYQVLETARTAGRPLPSARAVLDAFAAKNPIGVVEVLPDELKFEDRHGEIRTLDLKGLAKRISRMTSRPIGHLQGADWPAKEPIGPLSVTVEQQ